MRWCRRCGRYVPGRGGSVGYVYRADFVDPASLTKFVTDHYAMAPENFCAGGQVFWMTHRADVVIVGAGPVASLADPSSFEAHPFAEPLRAS